MIDDCVAVLLVAQVQMHIGPELFTGKSAYMYSLTSQTYIGSLARDFHIGFDPNYEFN